MKGHSPQAVPYHEYLPLLGEVTLPIRVIICLFCNICQLIEAEEEAARLFRGEPFNEETKRPPSQFVNNYIVASGGDPLIPTQQKTSDCVTTLTDYGINPTNALNICSAVSYLPLMPFPFLKPDATGTNSDYGSLHPNRKAGIEYALAWMYGHINPAWPDFGNGEDNCTNFVSQILRVGGFPQDNTWKIWGGYPKVGNLTPDQLPGCFGDNLFYNFHVVIPPGSICNPAWAVTPDLKDCLVSHKGFSTTVTNSYRPYEIPSVFSGSFDKVTPGDVVFFYSTGQATQPNHAGIVIGWGPPVDTQGKLDLNAPLVPWIADQSGLGHPRPINDLMGAVDKVEIVHVKYPGE